MKSKRKVYLGKSGRSLLKILCACAIVAEYGLFILLRTGVISPTLFFLQAHAFRESCYISLVLAIGGILLADMEEKRGQD